MTTATLPRLLGAAKLLASDQPGEAEAARLALIRMATGRAAPSPPPATTSHVELATACLRRATRVDRAERRFLLRMACEPRLLRDDAERLAAICERLGVGS